MVAEDYVSFETAKLLADKGFDESCDWSYSSNGTIFHHNGGTNSYFRSVNSQLLHVSRPTLQMTMKWLREKYNIHIEPGYFPMPNIYRYVIIHSPATIENISSHPQYFDTYEQACEAAIRYCLEILI